MAMAAVCSRRAGLHTWAKWAHHTAAHCVHAAGRPKTASGRVWRCSSCLCLTRPGNTALTPTCLVAAHGSACVL